MKEAGLQHLRGWLLSLFWNTFDVDLVISFSKNSTWVPTTKAFETIHYTIKKICVRPELVNYQGCIGESWSAGIKSSNAENKHQLIVSCKTLATSLNPWASGGKQSFRHFNVSPWLILSCKLSDRSSVWDCKIWAFPLEKLSWIQVYPVSCTKLTLTSIAW